jgi:hypothetical protein
MALPGTTGGENPKKSMEIDPQIPPLLWGAFQLGHGVISFLYPRYVRDK